MWCTQPKSLPWCGARNLNLSLGVVHATLISPLVWCTQPTSLPWCGVRNLHLSLGVVHATLISPLVWCTQPTSLPWCGARNLNLSLGVVHATYISPLVWCTQPKQYGSVACQWLCTTTGQKHTYVHTVESQNKGHFGTAFLSFVRRLSSLGGPKCIGSIGRKYLGTSSCILSKEIVLISECPLLEITPQ